MPHELIGNPKILVVFIGHDCRFLGDVRPDDWHRRPGRHVTNDRRAGFAAAPINQSHRCHLVIESGLLWSTLDAANKRLIDFQNAASATGGHKIARAQRLTDTMREEPRRIIPVGLSNA